MKKKITTPFLRIRASTSFDQNIEKKTKGASLYLHTPGYGRVGIHYDKDTDKYPDDFKMDTTRKGVSYDIQKEIGKGTLTAGASLGKSDSEFRKGKTKQGMISYTVPLGKAKGGSVRGSRKELRGTKFKGIF
jgi:outer membrane usher protein FimD/PapC